MVGLPHLWPFAQAWGPRAPRSAHASIRSAAVPRPFSGSENVVRKGQPQESSGPGGLKSGTGLPRGVWLLSSTVPRALGRAHRGTCLGHSGRRSPGVAGVGRAVRALVQQGQGGAVRAPPRANTFCGPAKPATAGGTGTQRGGGTSAWDSCRLCGNVEGVFSFIRHSLNKHLRSVGLGSRPPHPLSGALDVPVTSQPCLWPRSLRSLHAPRCGQSGLPALPLPTPGLALSLHPFTML